MIPKKLWFKEKLNISIVVNLDLGSVVPIPISPFPLIVILTLDRLVPDDVENCKLATSPTDEVDVILEEPAEV